MDATQAAPFKYSRLLPYWAVLQTDLRQTVRSWVYVIWVAVSVLAAAGYLLYRFGLHNEAGMVQKASIHTGDLLKWLALGSLSLIVVLTVSSISSERGTLADSVLSRGISRHQYFLAKWHSRMVVIMATFTVLFTAIFFGSYMLLKDDLSVTGGLTAILAVGAIMMAIVSCGVTIGALTSSTVLGITVLWIVLYGVGFLLTVLPESYPSPVRSVALIPKVLKGEGSIYAFEDLFLVSGIISLAAAGFGMIVFSRKDV